jgi:hypothetical protein
MSKSKGIEPLRLRQLRAMAGNLSSLANWHREHHNYVAADALQARSLSFIEQINDVCNDGNNIGDQPRTEHGVAHDILSRRLGEKAIVERAQKAG